MVQVERGMKHEDQIPLMGEGMQVPDMQQAGDVIVVLREQPHDRFKRKGKALIYKTTVPLADALCGFQFHVPHLDGRTIVVKSTPGQVLRPNMTYIIPREGMPQRGPSESGDLVVEVDIEFPSSLTPEEVEKLRAALGPMTRAALSTAVSSEHEAYETGMQPLRGTLDELTAGADEDDDDAGGDGEGHGPSVGCSVM